MRGLRNKQPVWLRRRRSLSPGGDDVPARKGGRHETGRSAPEIADAMEATVGVRHLLASKDGYDISVLLPAAHSSAPREAMDCACALYLNDSSAWDLPRQRSAAPH